MRPMCVSVYICTDVHVCLPAFMYSEKFLFPRTCSSCTVLRTGSADVTALMMIMVMVFIYLWRWKKVDAGWMSAVSGAAGSWVWARKAEGARKRERVPLRGVNSSLCREGGKKRESLLWCVYMSVLSLVWWIISVFVCLCHTETPSFRTNHNFVPTPVFIMCKVSWNDTWPHVISWSSSWHCKWCQTFAKTRVCACRSPPLHCIVVIHNSTNLIQLHVVGSVNSEKVKYFREIIRQIWIVI